ncbi:Lipoprotein-releasing system ATP-binding protein LolD [Serratia fonticola]|uniref:Lipoprotein-releasing system ATP-binding protein LolD n=2 Tax=Serratia fonticola TaxID=47917 RepID=A0A4V6KTT7_SERFO|nr:Lipoprotein-releasing system ATP-binding protein LolD [Serratia fonticola]
MNSCLPVWLGVSLSELYGDSGCMNPALAWQYLLQSNITGHSLLSVLDGEGGAWLLENWGTASLSLTVKSAGNIMTTLRIAQPLPVVSMQQAGKRFGKGPGAIVALGSITTEIHDGEFIALCGPSGSGKSTLLNLMGGIDYPTSGHVYLLGNDLSTLNDQQTARLRADAIGFVFQFFNLLPVLSVFDNVYYPLMLNGFSRRVAQDQVMDMIEKVGLAAHYKRTPGELSGGQQQRVAIARALVKRPRLIVADEPTGNLDTRTGQEIVDLLLTMNQELKTTFVISTHSLTLRDRAKRVLEIRDGELENDFVIA